NQSYKLNEKTNVYNIWQISSGKQSFHGIYGIRLTLNVINGKGEEVVDDTPT
ncbi:4082_t:CDS:1, partial [Funneliformis mosseae]